MRKGAGKIARLGQSMAHYLGTSDDDGMRMRGGYRKKYFRAVSRLTALAREAGGGVARGQG